MKNFLTELRLRTGDTTDIRPFVCKGNPLLCEVALVGINPASKSEFWKYCNDDMGFDRDHWIADYKVSGFNKSRSAIERFIPKVLGPIIELNVHAKQSARLADLEVKHRTTSDFEFIADVIKPKIIVCAGAVAYRLVNQLNFSFSPKIIFAKHYIYWGEHSTSALAEEINILLPR